MNRAPLLVCGMCGLPLTLWTDTNGYSHLFHGWDPSRRRKACPRGVV